MALSAAVELKSMEAGKNAVTTGVAATIYEGSILCYLAAGEVTNTPAVTLKFAGFAAETKTATDGGTIEAWRKGRVFVPNTGAALTDDGELLYVDGSAGDNDPTGAGVTVTGAPGDDACIGQIFRVEVGVGWWVDMDIKPVLLAA